MPAKNHLNSNAKRIKDVKWFSVRKKETQEGLRRRELFYFSQPSSYWISNGKKVLYWVHASFVFLCVFWKDCRQIIKYMMKCSNSNVCVTWENGTLMDWTGYGDDAWKFYVDRAKKLWEKLKSVWELMLHSF